jgi:hypothetical protein
MATISKIISDFTVRDSGPRYVIRILSMVIDLDIDDFALDGTIKSALDRSPTLNFKKKSKMMMISTSSDLLKIMGLIIY